jgi:hypothetical protein
MKYVLGLLFAALLGVTVAPAQGKFSGYMFGDYFYNVARDSSFQNGGQKNAAVGGKKDLQGFQIRRIYFTYDNDISETFATRFRLEADATAGSKEVDANGKVTVFVKDAYLKWKNIFKGSDLTFGFQPTSAYEISEKAWGYRSLDKTIMDLRGIVSSRELGVSLMGKLIESGMVNYWVTFSNNTGTATPNGTDPSTDKFKRYSANVQFKATDQLQFTAYASLLARPQINDPKSATAPPATLSNNNTTYALFAGYTQKDQFNVGIEGFVSSTANQIPNADTTGRAANNTLGISVFGSVNITPEFVAIARYDYFDPTTDGRYAGDARNYVIVGLSYKPDKNVQIIPNVQYETYQSVTNGRKIDPSVTARLTFYYTFL